MKWDDVQLFLKLAQAGTLKQAAAALKLDPSTVFRRLNALEEGLKVRLFERLPAGYALTAAGEQLLPHAERIEAEMLAAHTSLQAQSDALYGPIQLTTTTTLALSVLPPALRAFQERYPGITPIVLVSNAMISLSRREADVAITAGRREADLDAVGQRLCGLAISLYASLDYVERQGALPASTPWGGHRFLLPGGAMERLPISQWLRRQMVGGTVAAASDEFAALHAMARQGMGIAPLPDYLVRECDGLVKMRTVPEVEHSGIWLYHHPAVAGLARVRALTTFLCGYWGGGMVA